MTVQHEHQGVTHSHAVLCSEQGHILNSNITNILKVRGIITFMNIQYTENLWIGQHTFVGRVAQSV
jgi:hypothetical protein